MIKAEQSLNPSAFHRAFYGSSELRAGWRLFIFLAIVIALINASNMIVRGLLRGADDTTLFLVREVMDFLIFLLASWIMGRIEGRTIADYGLPWRRMFRVQFWQGVLLGFASITGLLAAMRVVGVFYFGSIAARHRHREVGNRIRVRFHPCRSARRVPSRRVRVIHSLRGHRFLASRNSLGSIIRLLSPRELWRGLDGIV